MAGITSLGGANVQATNNAFTRAGTPNALAAAGMGEPAAVQGGGGVDPNAWPPADGSTVTIEGRQFKVKHNRFNGHVVLTHNSVEKTQQGRVTFDVVLDFSPDGTVDRTIKQRLDKPTGAFEQQETTTKLNAEGIPLAESGVGAFREVSALGTRDTTETSSTEFRLGEPVKRSAVVDDIVNQSDPKGIESAKATQNIKAEWYNGGRPITEQTKPTLDLHETVVYRTKGGGINKDTDRAVTTVRRGVGNADALQWPDPMKVVIRFDGRGKQYIERIMEVPMTAKGEPDMAKARVVKNDDKQSLYWKSNMQVRIWGGLAGQVAGIAGLNLLRSKPAVGTVLMTGAVGMGVLETGAGTHAIIDGRNDGSYARAVMSAYDTIFWGLIGKQAGAWGGSGAKLPMGINGLPKTSQTLLKTAVPGTMALQLEGGIGSIGKADDADLNGHNWRSSRDYTAALAGLLPQVEEGEHLKNPWAADKTFQHFEDVPDIRASGFEGLRELATKPGAITA